MAEEITITIATNGDTKVSVKGVKGRSCKDLTREFEQALGSTVTDVDTKEAYEQPERVPVKNRA